MKKVFAVVLGLLAASGSAWAQGENAVPKALTCTFTDGGARALNKGQFKSEASGALTFDLESIDLEKLSAVMRTPRGAMPVRLVRAVNAFHVLEVVTEGFLNLTTIYDRDEQMGAMPAAHSRHFGILGQPIVSQYVGSCRVK